MTIFEISGYDVITKMAEKGCSTIGILGDFFMRHKDTIEKACAKFQPYYFFPTNHAKRQMELTGRFMVLGDDIENEPAFADGKAKAVGAIRNVAIVAAWEGKGVLLQQVKDRHPTLLLDLRGGRRQVCVVKVDVDNSRHHRGLRFVRHCYRAALQQSMRHVNNSLGSGLITRT